MLAQYILFLAKVATVVMLALILLAGILALFGKGRDKAREKLKIKNLNKKYKDLSSALRREILGKKELKASLKKEKQLNKVAKKTEAIEKPHRKKIFVLNFLGDVKATAVKALREEITAVLMIATDQDEVVVRLKSAGGIVHAYGLAASQLQRIRENNIPLVVIVDEISASGGYMMACVANRILAARFAVIGSIGVIAQIPNFHRYLRKKDIDFEQIMAGEYKRTLTIFGENTRKGRAKFQEEVDDVHALFKQFIVENRANVDINKVATGEHWYGQHALELNLVDGLTTSDDYLLESSKHADIYELSYITKKGIIQRLSSAAESGMETAQSLWTKFWQKNNKDQII